MLLAHEHDKHTAHNSPCHSIASIPTRCTMLLAQPDLSRSSHSLLLLLLLFVTHLPRSLLLCFPPRATDRFAATVEEAETKVEAAVHRFHQLRTCSKASRRSDFRWREAASHVQAVGEAHCPVPHPSPPTHPPTRRGHTSPSECP